MIINGGLGQYRDFYRVAYGMGGLVGVSLGLGGGRDSPWRLLMGSGTVPGFIQGWVGVRVGWWVLPLSWERGWYSPGRLLRGYGTIPGFILG